MTIKFTNLKGFTREINAFGRTTMPAEQKILQTRIVLDLLRRIVFRTPVKSGRARGNWQTSLGGATDSVLERFDQTGSNVISLGAQVAGSAPPYSLITLFNNVNYIRKLESGSSRQAPRGMVDLSVAEVESQFK